MIVFQDFSRLVLFQDAIWDSKHWSATWKILFDGLENTLLNGLVSGAFGWL